MTDSITEYLDRDPLSDTFLHIFVKDNHGNMESPNGIIACENGTTITSSEAWKLLPEKERIQNAIDKLSHDTILDDAKMLVDGHVAFDVTQSPYSTPCLRATALAKDAPIR